MKRSLPLYSVLISLAISLQSCRTVNITYPDTPGIVAIDGKVNCKAHITWGDHEISGRLLVKETLDGDVGIAFYNELGMTYVEGIMYIKHNGPFLVVKNIAPAMNYKPFIKNFSKATGKAFLYKPGFNPIPSKIELNNGFTLTLSP